jgi:hypothetical protein
MRPRSQLLMRYCSYLVCGCKLGLRGVRASSAGMVHALDKEVALTRPWEERCQIEMMMVSW